MAVDKGDAAAVNAVLQRILALTLDKGSANAASNPPVLFLESLAQELSDEQQPLSLSPDNLDRVIVNRLIEAPPQQYPQQPLHYLLGCYARATQELRTWGGTQQQQQQQQSQQQDAAAAGGAGQQQQGAGGVRGAIEACKQLLVSYAGLILTGAGVVPEPDEATARGSLQLLDAIDAAISSQQSSMMGPTWSPPPGLGSITPLPHGFMQELAAGQDCEGLGGILAPVVRELARRVQSASPIGQYAAPLTALKLLVSIEPVAKALVALPTFCPNLATGTGRALQLPGSSWLGPCFSVSAMPDELIRAEPDVTEACFAGVTKGTRTAGDVTRHKHTLHLASKHIVGELHGLVKALLGKSTREETVGWLAAALNGNKERGKMQENLAVAASHGFFFNLDALLLKLCGPFLDGSSSGVFWKRVDWKYVVLGERLDFKEDTKLAVSQAEEREWIEKEKAAAAAAAGGSSSSPEGYHFICEVFFMTLQALHLGVIKVIGNLPQWSRVLQELTQIVKDIDAGGMSDLPLPQLQRVRAEHAKFEGLVMGADTLLSDPDFIGDCLAFYKLVAAWMLSLVVPGGAAMINHPTLPLPDAVPPGWALLPEYFVEDLAEFLLTVTQMHPELLQSHATGLDGLMLFMVVFIGSPRHLKSPWLRSKLTDVLHAWLPRDDSANNNSFRRTRMSGLGASVSYLFEGHPLVVQHLVPSLLNLYKDVEVTDRHNQFYEKFSMRQSIGDILMHCWTLQPHRDVWKAYAAADGGRGPYQGFADRLISDSQYLLDEALKYVKEMRGLDERMDSSASLPPQERAQLQRDVQDTSGRLRSLLYLAGGVINTLAVSTTEVVSTFLLPEMVGRLADTLDYFLLYLTGPERKGLKVRDPSKYNWNPKELLAQICRIYLNVHRADTQSVFATAIADDARSYRPQMFAEAAHVLRQFQLVGETEIQMLESLAGQVAQAAIELQAQDDIAGDDIPSEFLDPIMSTLMRDPVFLPTSNMTMDRANILRHLLAAEHDPFNRQPLKADMLQPLPELRARIRAWLKEKRESKMAMG